jgi:glycosyltransferase involved in cell wall biosynthesis
MISVLLLNYNYGRYLADALDAIAAQTRRDFHVIIADDGSTDESHDLYKAYSRLIDRVVTGPHLGLGGNLDRSLPYCTGELLAVTSADDRWLACHLEYGVQSLEKCPDAGLSYSAIRQIDGRGQRAALPQMTLRRSHFPSGWISPLQLLPSQFIATQATIFRRHIIDEVGGIDTRLMLLELELMLRIVEKYPVVFTGRTTVEYRVHQAGMSRDPERMLRARLALYEKYFSARNQDQKARYVAAAHLRTAYRELTVEPTAATVRAARANVLRALSLDPAGLVQPLHSAMLLASLGGSSYAAAYPRVRRTLERSRAKLALQWLLGLKGSRGLGRVA